MKSQAKHSRQSSPTSSFLVTKLQLGYAPLASSVFRGARKGCSIGGSQAGSREPGKTPVAHQFTLTSWLTAISGLAVSMGMLRCGFVWESTWMILLGVACFALSIGWLLGSYLQRRNQAASVLSSQLIALFASALGVSLLYLISFWPLLAYVVRSSTPENYFQPFCLMYSPVANACPSEILSGYMMRCGLSDIEARFVVVVLRSEETKHTPPVFEFEYCFEYCY